MKIIRNSAKCNYCDTELVSEHLHDFQVHYCPKRYTPRMKWADHPDGYKILVKKDPPESDWLWAVDGGREYVRRCGSGFTDTSIYGD